MRFIEHLRDYREKLAEAAVRRYEATEQWIECPKCEAEVPTASGIHCPEVRRGHAGRRVRAGDAPPRRRRRRPDLPRHRLADGPFRGLPRVPGMSLDRIQGSNLWVSFRRV